jgi:RNA polymerase sigma factor (sigma-70 family)
MPILRDLDCLFRNGTLSALGDEEFLRRFLDRRDANAFEALLSLHGPMVLGICRRMLHDPRDVEDAFQATFLVLVRKAPTIKNRSLLASWLYGVAYRVANRARSQTIQRHAREIRVERLDDVEGIVEEFADIGTVLDQELNRLPAKYREPIVLCYLEGRTHDQAAAQLRCPVGTVRSRMARGRDLLKRRLTHRGCAPIAGMLGSGASLRSGALVPAVPAALQSATIRSALSCATLRGTGAAAVSAPILALTHGVITSMKLGQLTSIGLAMLATCLSATGVVSVAFARAQTAGSTTDSEFAAQKSAEPSSGAQTQIPNRAVQSITEAFDARLTALENKIDVLLNQSSTTSSSGRTATSTSTTRATSAIPHPAVSGTTSVGTLPAPSSSAEVSDRPIRAPGANRAELGRAADNSATIGSVRELETQLKLALEAFDRTETLFQKGRTSRDEHEQARGKVLLAAAVLEGLDDDLADELDRLKLEIKKKTAEVHQAEARKEMAAAELAYTTNLSEKQAVSEGQVAQAERKLRIAAPDVDIKQAELEEIGLQVNRLTRRRQRIAQAIKQSRRATTEVEAAPPARDGN